MALDNQLTDKKATTGGLISIVANSANTKELQTLSQPAGAAASNPTTPTAQASSGTPTAAQPAVQPTVTVPETTPDGVTKQTGVATGGVQPVAYTGTVDPSKTVNGLITEITRKDGDLMQLAAQRGHNVASRRGLGNSSLAAQAAQTAVLDAAAPIAQADASIYQNQQLQNQQSMNSAAAVTNDAMLSKFKLEIQNSAVDNEYKNRLIQQYMDGVNNVLNNNEFTSQQKQASLDKMYQNLQGTLALSASVAGIDFSQYKPGGAAGSQGQAGQGSASSPVRSAQLPAGADVTATAEFIKGKGVDPALVDTAAGAGWPLSLGNGAFLAFRGIDPFGQNRRNFYYNPADASYYDGGGSKVSVADLQKWWRLPNEQPWAL